jgi:hypothetical protein
MVHVPGSRESRSAVKRLLSQAAPCARGCVLLLACAHLLTACGAAPETFDENDFDPQSSTGQATESGFDLSPPTEPSASPGRQSRRVQTEAEAGEWVTLLRREMESRSRRPEQFRSTGRQLRIITEMGPNQSPHNPGFVTTNILSDETTLPLATVTARQGRLDSTTIDTAAITVSHVGNLYFYVVEHRRLAEWTVTIQEFRSVGP